MGGEGREIHEGWGSTADDRDATEGEAEDIGIGGGENGDDPVSRRFDEGYGAMGCGVERQGSERFSHGA